jgi:multimeric flavodoxin WrbA
VDLKRSIREADAVLVVTPEYNYSIPGVLKNAIDWAARPHGDNAWSGKPAAIMGASTGPFGTAQERSDAEGNLTDGATREFVRQLLHSLVDWTRRIGDKEQAKGDDGEAATRSRPDEQEDEGVLPNHPVAAGGVGA